MDEMVDRLTEEMRDVLSVAADDDEADNSTDVVGFDRLIG